MNYRRKYPNRSMTTLKNREYKKENKRPMGQDEKV